MRMRVRAAVTPARPDAGSLLGDPDQDDANAALPLRLLEVGPGDVLLRLAPLGTDDRDLVAAREALDRAHTAGRSCPATPAKGSRRCSRARRGRHEQSAQDGRHRTRTGAAGEAAIPPSCGLTFPAHDCSPWRPLTIPAMASLRTTVEPTTRLAERQATTLA